MKIDISDSESIAAALKAAAQAGSLAGAAALAQASTWRSAAAAAEGRQIDDGIFGIAKAPSVLAAQAIEAGIVLDDPYSVSP